MLINNDVLGIADRIKEIDGDYLLRYNPDKQQFVVMRNSYGKESCECVIPYQRLDERAVRYVRKTRKENIERLIKEIDRSNAELEKKEKYLTKKKIEESIETSCSRYYKKG